MIFEIWYYKATLPNSGGIKGRPILIIGDDGENNLSIVDIHYCLISSSSPKGKFDVEISDPVAKSLGLSQASVIKTTKVYTGSKGLLERKVCDLPKDLRDEFIAKYKEYQSGIMSALDENNPPEDPPPPSPST